MMELFNFWITKEYPDVRVHTRLFHAGNKRHQVIGITRIRNEELIIAETISHVSKFVDAIIAYDDCSTDGTLAILKKSKSVIQIIENKYWKMNRIQQETAHRQILFDAAKKYCPEWLFYFDADERFDLTREVFRSLPSHADGVRIRLYDAYMTEEDHNDYTQGTPLWGFRKYFGPEYRDVLMIFRNVPYIQFEGLDSREPTGCKTVIRQNYCQHYGKSLSVAHWEETCAYYATYFPEPYRTKWEQRKGKAIHKYSDFDGILCTWEDVKSRGISL